ncbi:uncharacterized protein K452DRAFT_300883 [Aplosporella prunicola CBS 121167]|uniref:Uncharacterized protein n=1 Tax=Aplosporella prunicola CBS 121167 TaxID=1176127 RepID=A0A6A6B5B2_9PEZI|nr:uncharacterized protein K452DRAFT_300883 [Aplosporella prunicola CBS 121167]KAF2138818.1 hypothetical protein K452DRAFT_300883 [Aplosporella prunicola CBS 121167]
MSAKALSEDEIDMPPEDSHHATSMTDMTENKGILAGQEEEAHGNNGTLTYPSPDNNSKATFFSLPRELRDEIYRLVLHKYTVSQDRSAMGPCEIRILRTPSMVKVNQQMRYEALLVFYKSIKWQTDLSETLISPSLPAGFTVSARRTSRS